MDFNKSLSLREIADFAQNAKSAPPAYTDRTKHVNLIYDKEYAHVTRANQYNAIATVRAGGADIDF